ncbi:MAG: glycosyltransferase [Chlorobiaceae bacterium]|nr:glycosyltransferase [Chlorobiaceae bacterium]
MPERNRILVIFSKNPVSGQVKTRLARSIGNEKALDVYEILRQHTEQVTALTMARRVVFYSGFIPVSDLFLREGTEAKLQQGCDLGERMHNAICEMLESGSGKVVLIGTDCPDLNTVIIEDAFSALENHDTVIGPAKDGGFYLIGLKKSCPGLFLQRTWSTCSVLRETIETLEKKGMSYMLLPELRDIDTFEDLKQSRLWNENLSCMYPSKQSDCNNIG